MWPGRALVRRSLMTHPGIRPQSTVPTSNQNALLASLPVLLPLAILLLLSQAVHCQEPVGDVLTPGLVTQDVLEGKIQEVESTADMDEQVKTKLADLYRKALSNLGTASSNLEAAEAFRRAAQTAPVQIQSIREEMAASSLSGPMGTLRLDPSASMAEVAQLLQKHKADLAAADATRADLDKRLDHEAARPTLIRQRLTEAKERQQEIAAELKLPPASEEGPAMTEARRWVLGTRYQALSAEITMLDQELLSQPVRLDLLRVKRDQEDASVKRVGARVKRLEDLLNRKRQDEAEKAKATADVMRRDAEGKHPLVMDLAGRNTKLSEELADSAAELALLAGEEERVERLAGQIESEFDGARETVAIGGLSQDLGHLLMQQRRSLPDHRSFRRHAKERKEARAKIGFQRLRHREEAMRLQDLDDYVGALAAQEAGGLAPEVLGHIRDLATARRDLLKHALETDELLLRKLGELKATELRLLSAIADYDRFLNEHLLWVRSASRARLERLGVLPEQMWRILSPTGWLEVASALAYQARRSTVFVLLALSLSALFWGRRRLLAAIRHTGQRLGKPTTDRFGYSVLALILTLLTASTWPLVMVVAGWGLKLSVESTEFSTAVAQSLLIIAAQFFYLCSLRLICMPGGLAAVHFRWPEVSLRLLRAELDRLAWVFLPAAFVMILSHRLDPLYVSWEIGRVSSMILYGSLAFAFFRLLHRRRGVLAGYLRHREHGAFWRLYPLWHALLVAAPLALGVISLLGFRYSAATLLKLLLATTWMGVALVLLNALAVRWLQVTRRHLAYEAAMERREALSEARQADGIARAGDEGVPFDLEEPEVDLAALSDASRKLLNTAIVFSGLVGLVMIWSEVLPALGILDNVTLWHHAVTVDGEERLERVTPADIGLALFFGVVTILLAKQLPAVLEIVLLKYSEMSAGSRYTVTTLTTYTIVTIGVVLVLKAVGVDWSKLQWLVAALGVGVGFGLQEIVANFISGIIILFERPVRVGDVVTVGDTDGTVTRIRIRATTIKNWDGKELLVPNKEFITGRLLNWSLSDQTTRILISVGIAYGSNVREAMRLLEQAATEHESVLDAPAPSVIFESFGDNALSLVLRCFVDSVDLRVQTVSALNQSINDKFNAAGIAIAFPQRDLHLDTARPLQVELRRGKESPPSDGDPVETS